MLNTINTKILLIIIAILGAIGAGIAWQNERAAAIDKRMENERKEILRKYADERDDQTRKSRWGNSVKNYQPK